MNRQQISWWLWAAGTVLITLSWCNVVSTTVGWTGFFLGLVGSILPRGLRPPRRTVPPPDRPQQPQDQGPAA